MDHIYRYLIKRSKNYFALYFCSIFFLLSCSEKIIGNNNDDNTIKRNKIEAYRATLWHLPYTQGKSGNWGRPTFGVIDINNNKYSIRHTILEGRELGDYRLPYHPTRSFLSIYNSTVELSHRGSVEIGSRVIPFRCGDEKYKSNSFSNKRIEEGFELSKIKGDDILRISNKGSGSPVLLEHHFIIKEGSSIIPVIIKATNTTNETIDNLIAKASYSQDFNWSYFGIATSNTGYNNIIAPISGKANAFFAFSSGMNVGFEFMKNDNCELSYRLDDNLNAWHVTIKNAPTSLKSGESITFTYTIKIIDSPSKNISDLQHLSLDELNTTKFFNLIPSETRKAPIDKTARVSINEMINNIEKPKVRGLHRFVGIPRALEQLTLLKEWEGNLAITHGDPMNTKQIISHGHSMGIEMLLTGNSSFTTGEPPSFDPFFSSSPMYSEFPDAYGQDEDHQYWGSVKATLDFESIFKKPMCEATQEEKVKYWSRCFTNKWVKTLESINKNDPNGEVFFYIPAPSVAYIQPLDYYNLFFNEIAKLGDNVTVFPFYYGIDYNQIEYMVRRWKNSGVARVVFLPGCPTYLKPSQFFRAISAARRGGADGVCGFAFTITENIFDEEWRWKSVLLAAQCNFPTEELRALSLIEEPAELVEKLSDSNVSIYFTEVIDEDFATKLYNLIPGTVKLITEFSGTPAAKSGELAIVFSKDSKFPDKGVITMSNGTIVINSSNDIGFSNAKSLLLKFAELSKAERYNQ